MASSPVSSQLLLRGLDGRTTPLRFSTDTISGSSLYDRVSSLFHLPVSSFLLLTGTKLITAQTCLASSPSPPLPFPADLDPQRTDLSPPPLPSHSHTEVVYTVFPSCSLLLRLRGGKGGFGSLLRGAATKAGQKKTSNFDACRDMSGRRLRHVNAEKKLKEWRDQSKERELEQAANEYLKKQAKKEKKDSGCAKVIEKYREETFKSMEDVEDAVLTGLAEAKKFGKRKIVDDAVPSSSSKRAQLWFSNEDDAMEGSDEEDDDAADDRLSEDEHDRDVSEEKSAKEASEKKYVQEGSENKDPEETSEKRIAEEVSRLEQNEVQIEGNVAGHGLEYEIGAELLKDKDMEGELKTECVDMGREKKNLEEGYTKPGVEVVSVSTKVEEGRLAVRLADKCHGNAVENVASSRLASNGKEAQCQLNGESNTNGNAGNGFPDKLNFDAFQSASDLEVLGLEKLKQELQSRGLKCGGNLAERAGRLFLLKTIPIDKLDKKHFAKSTMR